MKALLFIFLSLLYAQLFAQLTNTQIHNLKSGKVKQDDSYVYHLPFAKGKKYLLIQAYNSSYSHKKELSLDFKMKPGCSIHAARNGVVTSIKKDSDIGGLKEAYLNEGNHVIITHDDGSYAMYWHLQKNRIFVNVGDTIQVAQLIGYSGNTGYTAFPHLHFQVQNKNGEDLATRFFTKKGIIYLRPGKYYKAVDH